jgi:hypothetical protein
LTIPLDQVRISVLSEGWTVQFLKDGTGVERPAGGGGGERAVRRVQHDAAAAVEEKRVFEATKVVVWNAGRYPPYPDATQQAIESAFQAQEADVHVSVAGRGGYRIVFSYDGGRHAQISPAHNSEGVFRNEKVTVISGPKWLVQLEGDAVLPVSDDLEILMRIEAAYQDGSDSSSFEGACTFFLSLPFGSSFLLFHCFFFSFFPISSFVSSFSNFSSSFIIVVIRSARAELHGDVRSRVRNAHASEPAHGDDPGAREEGRRCGGGGR